MHFNAFIHQKVDSIKKEKHSHKKTQICIITQIPYRLFDCYIHHVAMVNILPKMAASSVISVKLC